MASTIPSADFYGPTLNLYDIGRRFMANGYDVEYLPLTVIHDSFQVARAHGFRFVRALAKVSYRCWVYYKIFESEFLWDFLRSEALKQMGIDQFQTIGQDVIDILLYTANEKLRIAALDTGLENGFFSDEDNSFMDDAPFITFVLRKSTVHLKHGIVLYGKISKLATKLAAVYETYRLGENRLRHSTNQLPHLSKAHFDLVLSVFISTNAGSIAPFIQIDIEHTMIDDLEEITMDAFWEFYGDSEFGYCLPNGVTFETALAFAFFAQIVDKKVVRGNCLADKAIRLEVFDGPRKTLIANRYGTNHFALLERLFFGEIDI